MITSQEFWDRRSRHYDDQIGPLYQEAYQKTQENTWKYLTPQSRVLEFACGTGIMTFSMAPRAAWVRAIDISGEMVRLAREKQEELGAANVEITRTDLFDPCLEEGSFDAVAAFNVLCYVEDLPGTLERLRRLVKPGGMFLSATDCLGEKLTRVGLRKFWRSRTGKMPYVAFFIMDKLRRAVEEAGFQVVEEENLFPSPPNLFLAARRLR